jgi:GNAT superfamily N-acetyltransferase
MFDVQPMLPGSIEMCAMIARANWPGDKRVAEKIHEELKDPNIHYCVALARGRVIGFAGWSKSNIDYGVAEFVWCNVLEDFRGRGIGRLLTDYRLADIRAAGFKAVICGTMVPNIYRAYNFQSLGKFDLAHGRTDLMILKL